MMEESSTNEDDQIVDFSHGGGPFIANPGRPRPQGDGGFRDAPSIATRKTGCHPCHQRALVGKRGGVVRRVPRRLVNPEIAASNTVAPASDDDFRNLARLREVSLAL